MSFEWPIQKFLVHRHSSRHALRNQMIADTERFLNAAIYSGSRARPDRRLASDSPHWGQPASRTADALPGRVSWQTARHATDVTILQLSAQGGLDRVRLRRLLRPLDRIVAEKCRGDVVLDFAALNPVTLRVIDMAALLQRRLQQRKRQLLVCGLPDTPSFMQRAAHVGVRTYPTQRDAVEHLLLSVGAAPLE